MAERKQYHVQEGGSALCLLCNKLYCERHKGGEDDVCEINHATYYMKRPDRSGIFPSMEKRKGQIQENEKRSANLKSQRSNQETDGSGEPSVEM